MAVYIFKRSMVKVWWPEFGYQVWCLPCAKARLGEKNYGELIQFSHVSLSNDGRLQDWDLVFQAKPCASCQQ